MVKIVYTNVLFYGNYRLRKSMKSQNPIVLYPVYYVIQEGAFITVNTSRKVVPVMRKKWRLSSTEGHKGLFIQLSVLEQKQPFNPDTAQPTLI